MKKPTKRQVKVLYIRQPFADWIVFDAVKWSENRTWNTRYRGELYIHASRWDGTPEATAGHGTVGAIIGKVNLVDVVDLDAESNPTKQLRLAVRAAREHGLPFKVENLEHVVGPYCFIFTNPTPLKKPIPALGKLNIWTFSLTTGT